MKTLIITLGLITLANINVIAQNKPVNTQNNSVNSENNLNNTNQQTNPNYDHLHNYYQIPYGTSQGDPHVRYLKPADNPAPVNNNNNNNTMTPYNNTTSPYDVTSPYYTPPNADAPLNNTPPVR